MLAKTNTVEELREWDRKYHWHPFTQMQEYQPLIIEQASGCMLIDVEGRELVDGVSSLWCNVHGHGHPKLNAAIRDQLDDVAHVTSLGMSNPVVIRLAKRLVEITPDGLDFAFFSDSGASAVEVAVKMALQYWQQRKDPRPDKKRYISFGQAYHGDTIGMVSLGGMPRFHEVYEPLLFQPIRLPSPATFPVPDGIEASELCSHYLGQLESVLAQHHDEIAALIIEPLVQGAAGMVMQPSGYLKGVRELTRRYDVLMIADEVAVGMGRTGKMFACEHEHVQPDLMCIAKGLTGGYLPVSATMASQEIYDAFLGDHGQSRTFFHGHTYAGNPLGCAVALASLELFEEESTLEKLQPKIRRLTEHLRRISQLKHVGDVRQCGFMAGIELMRDGHHEYPWKLGLGNHVCREVLKHGVWLRPLGNVIVIMPPLVISLDELDFICNAAESAIRQVTENQELDD